MSHTFTLLSSESWESKVLLWSCRDGEKSPAEDFALSSKVRVKKEEGGDVLCLVGESGREKKNEYLILLLFASAAINIQERAKPAELPSNRRAGGMRAKLSMKGGAHDKLKSSECARTQTHTHAHNNRSLFCITSSRPFLGVRKQTNFWKNVLGTGEFCLISLI